MRFDTKWIIAFAVLPLSAYGQMLFPSQDSYLVPGNANNFGTAPTVTVGSSSSVGLLQFDLTQLPAGVTTSQVTKATLTIFVDHVGAPGTFNLSSLSSATHWAEPTVTGTSGVSPGTSLTANVAFSAANQFITLDVTAAVASWIANSGSNNGFYFAANSGNFQFDSKENTTTSHPAFLNVMLAGGAASIYGDGSDGTTSGVCSIGADTDWTSSAPLGSLQCTAFSVARGVTLNVPTGLIVRSTGPVTINGTITVAPGPRQGLELTSLYNSNLTGTQATAFPPAKWLQLLHPGVAGGGYGGGINGAGSGGGNLTILAFGAIAIGATGQIIANGGDALDSLNIPSGGGAGGVILLASRTAAINEGTITATGGKGADGFNSGFSSFYGPGGGGGGGVIHFLAPAGQMVTGNSVVVGGSAGGNAGVIGPSMGGGACGGNGGVGSTSTTIGQAGSIGLLLTTNVSDPATIFIP